MKRWNRGRRSLVLIGFAILLGAGLAGCGTPQSAAPAATLASSTDKLATSPSSGAAAPNTEAPVFTLTSITGSPITVPDGHPMVLYFMSAQCGSCIQGEQQLAQLQGHLSSVVHLVSIDVTPQYDTPQALSKIAQTVGAHWPQTFATLPLLHAYDVTQLDQVAVIAASGHMIYNGGLPSNAQLLSMIQQGKS
ncbi:MAG: TlpA family protein disulfide reductase [Sulfobacillus sp.]